MIKTIRVGGKFPTNLNFTSGTYEIEYELPEGETLEQATAKCKLLVAREVSGGDSSLLKTALKVLNYPSQSDEVNQLVAELSIIDRDILKLRRELRSKQKYVAELLTISTKLDALEAVHKYFDIAEHFWGLVRAIAEQPDFNTELLDDSDDDGSDDDDDDGNDGDDGDYQPTLAPAEEEHF